jgi:hypothetical protein
MTRKRDSYASSRTGKTEFLLGGYYELEEVILRPMDRSKAP